MVPANKIKNRIVFISHDASLTGAPMLLLNLLTVLKNDWDSEVLLILHRGGELEEEFKKLYPITILKGKSYGKRSLRVLDIVDFLIYHWKVLILRLAVAKYDFVFSNTIANGRILKWIKRKGVPVITYVHELSSIIEYYKKDRDSQYSFLYSDLLLYPSEAVKKGLIDNYGISPNLLKSLRYYFPASSINNEKDVVRRQWSNDYKLSVESFWVVSMGTGTLRKGLDYFVEIARIVSKSRKDIVFFWIGPLVDENLEREMVVKIKENGMENNCILTGRIDWNISNLLPFDLFVLPSREDPYPLVVIEAGYNNLPALIFGESGGIGEFVKDDAGWQIEGFSCKAMADKIIELSNNKALVYQKGIIAKERALTWHFSKRSVLDDFKLILESVKKN